MAVMIRGKALPLPIICGANAGSKTAITTVRQELNQIMAEWRAA